MVSWFITHYIRGQWPNLTLIYLAYKMKFQIYYIDVYERASTENKEISHHHQHSRMKVSCSLLFILLVMMTYLLFLAIFFVIFLGTLYHYVYVVLLRALHKGLLHCVAKCMLGFLLGIAQMILMKKFMSTANCPKLDAARVFMP
ncbi:hypothetical protein PRUPE_2G245500 [Prunus persica]|uniref:Uncharacterized protein n=1 Tax=Prunus persica TaxID=3760 RepID=A0A251QL42_PRUPE|nr:hypothetical protein PRUPE_2G245500 [Prunus persica]